MPQPVRRLPVALIVAAFTAAGVAASWLVTPASDLPQPGTSGYERAARFFYRGLAGLQVGLLDGAVSDFTTATGAAAGEPAIWANLGLAHLRLGAFDAAASALERAATLAPDNGGIVFLRSRLETARGDRDAAVRYLRRAVELDPADLPARTALIQEIEDAAGPDADVEAQRLLEDIVQQQPDNLAMLVDRARLAAKRGDAALLGDSMGRLAALAPAWPPEVIEQFRAVQQAVAQPDTADPTLELAFLRNVLARVPAFLESRRAVTASAELIADPFLQFLTLPAVQNTPAGADRALSYVTDVVGSARRLPWSVMLAVSLDGESPPALFVADASTIERVSGAGTPLPFPGGDDAVAPGPDGLVAVDWNHDFRLDLAAAGAGGVRLYLQAPDGTFSDATEAASAASGPLPVGATGVWAADVEMDGDLDLIIGVSDESPLVLRNNGNGEWAAQRPLAGLSGLRAFAWADLDDDGDPDAAMLDATGGLHVFANRQAGLFEPMTPPPGSSALAGLAIADGDADGRMDVVTVDRAGEVRLAGWAEDGWREAVWAQAPPVPAGDAQLTVADLDNNGALDLVVSSAGATSVRLAGVDRTLAALDVDLAARDISVVDLDADGLLDLVGLVDGRPARLTARASRDYHFQVVRPRAQAAAGDQRINTFGLGGFVEVQSGLLVQRQVITGPVVHVGLGNRTTVDVTRIVWPNGVPQAEFDAAVDQAITAEQRLKGSCPWVFADDGTGLRFVTDFLWRSPLGLRINAQDTAGVTQTEDWVRIRGDQLAAKSGAYDIRISAELWETHFIDHVSLMVVDHPDDMEVFVDERFVPGAPPALTLHATTRLVPVRNARDDGGRDVTGLIASRDGEYLSTFARGPYQGIADDHFVEFDIDTPIRADAPSWIVAHGWIYPTDSSINVAIGQGGHVVPRSLALEAQAPSGQWVPVAADLGFPAGKNKTVLIDLRPVAAAGLAGAHRLRLRTNLEIYWDQLATAAGADDSALRTERLLPSVADLRYRGYSQTHADRRDLPELPDYSRIATTTPRWRDLVGYYTRFGDVRELLAGVEDRYVIMNAGDELRLSFAAPAAPDEGWTRDFVLVGDGWVKDGDFNTSFSKTVLPLPTHADSRYAGTTPAPSLESDPVYRQHAGDWRTFHTRYVTPDAFLRGLGMAARAARP